MTYVDPANFPLSRERLEALAALRSIFDPKKPQRLTVAEERSMSTEILRARIEIEKLRREAGWEPCGGCGALTQLQISSPRFPPGPCCEKCAAADLQVFAEIESAKLREKEGVPIPGVKIVGETRPHREKP